MSDQNQQQNYSLRKGSPKNYRDKRLSPLPAPDVPYNNPKIQRYFEREEIVPKRRKTGDESDSDSSKIISIDSPTEVNDTK